MICPHCEYEYKFEYDAEGNKVRVGDKGDFFWLNKKLRREDWTPTTLIKETTNLFACPNCKKAFIEVG